MIKTLAAALMLVTAPSLFAAADLTLTAKTSMTRLRAGSHYSLQLFSIGNHGPDAAQAVKVTVTSTIPVCCNAEFTVVPPGQTIFVLAEFDAPLAAGDLAITATVTSATADPNPSDNSATFTFQIGTEPDILVGLGTLGPVDLGLPFTLTLFLNNAAKTTAHDVNATLTFPPSLFVVGAPAACDGVDFGKIVCHMDELPPTGSVPRTFDIVFKAPRAHGVGVTFNVVVTEQETDFDGSSNQTSSSVTLYDTIYVTTTADSGAGSLRQAIEEANASCNVGRACTIGFDIEEKSQLPWRTIVLKSPLPAITAPRLRIAGATQAGLVGDTNPEGPEIEISGGGTLDGDGLVINGCGADVGGLTINGFGGNGLSVVDLTPPGSCEFGGAVLHDLYVGTDPTGSAPRPNLRGIGVNVSNGTSVLTRFGSETTIRDSLVSGNRRSGVFALSGRVNLIRNRIGVKARADEPLPNGNAGVYIGLGGYGSDVGPNVFSLDLPPPDRDGNVIAFNGQMGVAVAAGVGDVAIRHNRIWGNGGLGIDVGLDGPTPAAPAIPSPVLTLAHYDPAAKQTVIEGDLDGTIPTSIPPAVDFFANGGERALGTVRVTGRHFRFAFDGDLTGERITATATRYLYLGIEEVTAQKAQGIDQLLLTQTSEFSPPIEVR